VSRPPGGQGERWNAIRARRAEELRDAQAQALVDAFKAALAAWDPNERFAVAVSAAMTSGRARVPGPGGQRSSAAKARIMSQWQAQRDEHWARHGKGYSITRPGQLPVFASATAPGDVSPLLRRIYG
jgi:hypothetical protein